jgi:hypothetical protein
MTLTKDKIKVGDAMPEYRSAPVTRSHLVRYAGASGDFNPLHHDETFARMIGMESVIAHGMLIMGIVGEAIVSWIEHKYLRKFQSRFLGMTEPVNWNEVEKTQNRATIVVSGKVVKKYEENGETRIRCNIVAKDLTGSRKLDGFFIAALP